VAGELLKKKSAPAGTGRTIRKARKQWVPARAGALLEAVLRLENFCVLHKGNLN